MTVRSQSKIQTPGTHAVGDGHPKSKIRQWFATRKGNANGLPVVYVAINMEPAAFYQAQTDVFLRATNLTTRSFASYDGVV